MRIIKKIFLITICMMMILNCGIFVQARTESGTIKSKSDFEKIADEYMKKAMDKYHVVGVTVSVVKDGKVFFKKGYGYADLDKKTAVDPDKTKFELASTTKLVTATAAMQLVEQGKIGLEEDVSKYLGEIKIKNKFNTPITLRNLLTHTAGFDEDLQNIISKENEEIKPLEHSLKEYIPEIIRRPGTCIQYSNHGYTLIGYLVEKISGVPFDKYVTDNIINKIGMDNSIYFRDKDTKNMSKPYRYENEEFKVARYDNGPVHPAGSICSTAGDMAKFMIMHLNNGIYEGAKVLKEETAVAMHNTAFTSDKNLLGYTLGFYENFRNGNKTIEHGGDNLNFHTQLTILPEKKIGLFLSCNTSSPNVNKIREEFADKFYEFFIEKGESSVQIFNENNIVNSINIRNIDGCYKSSRYPRNEILKAVLMLPMGQIKVKSDKQGEIVLSLNNEFINKEGSQNSDVVFKNVADSLFYSSEIDRYVKFIDKDNEVLMVSWLPGPGQTFEKVSNIDNYSLYAVLFGGLVSVLGVIVALILLIRKKYRGCNKEKFISKILLLITCLLLITYIGGNGLLIKSYINANIDLASLSILFIRILGFVIGFFVIIFNVNSIIMWKNKIFSLKIRLFYSLICIISIVNVFFMYITNVFKF